MKLGYIVTLLENNQERSFNLSTWEQCNELLDFQGWDSATIEYIDTFGEPYLLTWYAKVCCA